MQTNFQPYFSYMANEKLQGEKEFHTENCLLEMHRSHAKICLKSAPQKLNLGTTKLYQKVIY